MSKHPNFDSVQFAVDVTASYIRCLKNASAMKCPPPNSSIGQFVIAVEALVDAHVDSRVSMMTESQQKSYFGLKEKE